MNLTAMLGGSASGGTVSAKQTALRARKTLLHGVAAPVLGGEAGARLVTSRDRSRHRSSLWVLGICAAVVAAAAISPATALAFQGESLVIEETPSGPTLTPPAETIITNPTFLPDETAAAGLAEESTTAAEKGLVGADFLPYVGRVLPWVGGAIGAVEVCREFLGGCFIFDDAGEDDPSPSPYVGWYEPRADPCVGCGPANNGSITIPAFHWYAFGGGNLGDWSEDWSAAGCPQWSFPSFPPEATGSAYSSEPMQPGCAGSSPLTQRDAIRSVWANRAAPVFSASDDPSIPDYSGSPFFSNGSCCTADPATDWADHMATELQGDGILTQHDADILGQYIAHEIDPRCQPDPFRSTVTVPEILDDETPNQYQACLDTLSLNGNVTTLNATDTTVANGAVVETAPEAGTEVTLETQVDVAANPSQAVGSHYTEDCDPNGTGQSGSPVGNPPPDGTGYPYFQLVQGSPYDVSTDPRSGEIGRAHV